MTKDIIYKFTSPYRGDFKISAYHFNEGEKACCIVGALRGNEIQQLYICSKLIRALDDLEKRGEISQNNKITVIPCVNPFSVNVGKKFWCNDDRDINRDFPGSKTGETTQRIAAEVLNTVGGYKHGIHFASFYIQGDFIPHIKMMETGKENKDLATLFGLPYVVLREPKPFDEHTLNFNWQKNNTNAFSLYTNETENIDEESSNLAVASVLRFLSRTGIIQHNCDEGFVSSVFKESSLIPVRSTQGGICRRIKHSGDEAVQGEVMAEILHPYENRVLEEITAPVDGIVFFSHKSPLVSESTVVYKLIKRSKN